MPRSGGGEGAAESRVPVITASEIGDYAYCSRAWWYRHVAKVPLPEGDGQSRLAEGTRAHGRHGTLVSRSLRLQALGVILAIMGLAVLALSLLVR